MSLSLRPHQQQALARLELAWSLGYDSALIKMFCGTGKTRLVFQHILDRTDKLTLLVFPSIALISQFNLDYVNNQAWKDLTRQLRFLAICSKDELKPEDNFQEVEVTTEPERIEAALTTNQRLLISVTYQSLEKALIIISQLPNRVVDLAIFDEAHRLISKNRQQLLLNSPVKLAQRLFLTATPKNVEGFIMLERDYDAEAEMLAQDSFELDFEEESLTSNPFLNSEGQKVDQAGYCYLSDCGVLVYEYSHRQAVRDQVCNDFQLLVDFHSVLEARPQNNKYQDVYAAISRAICNTGNRKILTFHAGAFRNNHDRSVVTDFLSSAQKTVFKDIYQQTLTKLNQPAGKLTLLSLTGQTMDRQAILRKFEQTSQPCLLASCRTIGEGVDLKTADMVVFVDPRRSHSEIIQNIGRVCRLSPGKQTSVVLIPQNIEPAKYQAQTSLEGQSRVIQAELTKEDHDFSAILNVLAALREDDPQYYDLALLYPKSYSKRELSANLKRQGYQVLPQPAFNLGEAISGLVGSELSTEVKLAVEQGDLESVSQQLDRGVELHWSELREDSVWSYGCSEEGYLGSEEPLRLLWSDQDQAFYPVVSQGEASQQILKPPSRRKTKVSHSSDLVIYWSVDELVNLAGQAYLRSMIVGKADNKWDGWYQALQDWLEQAGHYPKHSSQDQDEGRLATWVNNQRTAHREGKLSTRRTAKLKALDDWSWNLHLDNWLETYRQLQSWLKRFGQYPKHNGERDEKDLASWISNQRTAYRKLITGHQSSNVLTVEQIQLLQQLPDWSWDLQSDGWFKTYYQLESWLEQFGHYPKHSGECDEKELATWVSNQRTAYSKLIKGQHCSNKLTAERIRALQSLPNWQWHLRNPIPLATEDQLRVFEETGFLPVTSQAYSPTYSDQSQQTILTHTTILSQTSQSSTPLSYRPTTPRPPISNLKGKLASLTASVSSLQSGLSSNSPSQLSNRSTSSRRPVTDLKQKLASLTASLSPKLEVQPNYPSSQRQPVTDLKGRLASLTSLTSVYSPSSPLSSGGISYQSITSTSTVVSIPNQPGPPLEVDKAILEKNGYPDHFLGQVAAALELDLTSWTATKQQVAKMILNLLP